MLKSSWWVHCVQLIVLRFKITRHYCSRNRSLLGKHLSVFKLKHSPDTLVFFTFLRAFCTHSDKRVEKCFSTVHQDPTAGSSHSAPASTLTTYSVCVSKCASGCETNISCLLSHTWEEESKHTFSGERLVDMGVCWQKSFLATDPKLHLVVFCMGAADNP